jgi:hypothetical protein
MERFHFKKLCEVESEEEYRVGITSMFVALEKFRRWGGY